MARFKAFTKRNPCPICHGHNGCKESKDSNLILCRGVTEDPQDPHWYCTGQSEKDSQWFTFVPRHDFTNIDPVRYQQDRLDRIIKQEQEKAAKAAGALPIGERDRHFRKLAAISGLSQTHKNDLLDRGLTEDQITRFPFFTFQNGLDVRAFGIPDNLPGVEGGKLRGCDGLAIPAMDKDNRVIGYQVRVDNHELIGGGKYRWLINSHLPNRELPVTVILGNPESKDLFLCEGILKPLIAAEIHGINVMGAAGGNFSGSLRQVKDVNAALQPERLVITIDAGDLVNPQVTQRWQYQINSLKGLGLPIVIAYWGQGDSKEKDDIDELDSLDGIHYLEPVELFPNLEQFTKNPPIPWLYSHFGWGKKKVKKSLSPTRKEEKRPIYFYNPDHSFPTQEQWESWDKPIIEYAGGADRAIVISRALANGFNVWDRSWMGLGKSHCVPEIKGQFNKIYYLSQEHRNPTVDRINDEFTDLIPRTAYGYYLDGNGKLKEASRDYDGKLVIQSNCSRTEMFRNVFSKGHSIFREKTEDQKTTNPICEICPMLNACRASQGNGYGYLNQRSKALENRKIRTDINGLDRFCGYEESLIITDELKSLNPTKQITSNHNQRVLELDRLRDSLNPEVFSPLDGLIQDIKRLSAGDTGRYGLDTKALREALPNIDYLDDLIDVLEANPQDLTDFFKEPDSVQTGDKNFKNLERAVNKLFGKENLKETLEKLEQLPPNTLVYLLKLIRGDKGVEANLMGDKLTLTVDNRGYQEDILKQAKGVVLLDATATPEQVRMATGIDDWLIIQEDIKKPLKNLTIRAIETEGLGSNDWSDTTIERIKAVRGKLGDDIPTLAFKKYQEELGADGYWFKDNIGSNAFKGKPEMIMVGTPYPDYGATKRQYLCLGGKEEDFDEYYRSLVRQQMLQAVGRQRSHLYPDQQFTINWIGTDLDLDWLKEYGATIERVSAYEITPEAGTKNQVIKTSYLEAIKCLSEKGIKVTQRALAALLGKSQSTISGNLARWGMTLKDLLSQAQKIIGSPIESNNSPTDNPELARFLGIDIQKEFEEAIDAIKELGFDGYISQIFDYLPETLRLKLLGYLIAVADHSELMTT